MKPLLIGPRCGETLNNGRANEILATYVSTHSGKSGTGQYKGAGTNQLSGDELVGSI
jgi:hypothetical protein